MGRRIQVKEETAEKQLQKLTAGIANKPEPVRRLPQLKLDQSSINEFSNINFFVHSDI